LKKYAPEWEVFMNKKIIYRNIIAVLCLLCLFLTSGVIFAQAASPSVEFSAHVQNKGWLDYVSDGNIAGTVGEELQMEAIKIHLKNASGKIWYKVYVQDAGWQDWVSNDKVAGTEGKSKRIEAIKIQITGDIYDTYDIFYRAHVGNIGWLGWTKNGGIAGTIDVGTRIEAVQIVLKKKDQPEKMSTSYATKPTLKVNSHVQGKGWLGYVGEGETSGTEGQSLRMEALNINCPDLFGGSGITYRAHVQDVGWQNWVSSGESVGTTGQSKSMEAVQIQLKGYLSKFYDIYYRAHVRDIGWMGWARNGEFAGTTGGSKPMEAIQVKLLIKGDIINKGGDAYKDLTAQATNSPSSNEENQTNYAKVPVSSNKPIICYTLNSSGKVYAYTSAALTKKAGGYIACSTDECRILQVYGNAVQVKYPVSKGTKTAWFERSAFTNCNIADNLVKTWKQTSKIIVYRRSDGKVSFGSISAGDTCYELSTSGNYTQIVYPVSGGYKMGWIRTGNIATTKLSYGLYKKDSAYISCGFDGYKNTSGRHEGIDIQGGNGSSIYSLTDGEVVRVTYGKQGSNGLSTIAIYDSDANKTIVYLHSSPTTLEVGQKITTGQYIGKQDWRGVSSSSGGHTHVEVVDGKTKSAKKSVGDKILDNSDPTSYWNSKGYIIQ